MTKPLSLFIKPPYHIPPINDVWTVVHEFGIGPLPSIDMHNHVLLRYTGPGNGDLFAAATGKLSIYPPYRMPPFGGWVNPTAKISIPSPGEPLPDSVTLYLQVSPFRALDIGFTLRAREIIPAPIMPMYILLSSELGLYISAFAYLNVETASLETALAEQLDKAYVPSAGPLKRSEVVEMLVKGQLDVPILQNHPLGQASKVGAPAGSRQVAFGTFSQYGAVDPSYTYDWMRNFVADDQQDLNAFLVCVPKKWPIITATTSTAAIAETRNNLYSMPVLLETRNRLNLSPIQWREVGNNQKNLWLARLLMRAGKAASYQHPPFEFKDEDVKNIFQLEAITEFYMNFADPWQTGAAIAGKNEPRSPFLGDGVTPNPYYVKVDFLNPAGDAATIIDGSFNIVTLDGISDLTRVRVHPLGGLKSCDSDLLFLETDTARPNRLYKILAVVGRTVTLEGFPNLTGNSSAWEIKLRPNLVLIDSFAARDFTDIPVLPNIPPTRHNLHGEKAQVTAPKELTLDGNPNLSRVNLFFDTIYLPSDTARGSRTYRITRVIGANAVLLEENPSLFGGSSKWHISAGVSAKSSGSNYTLGPGGASGFDHYDGHLFLIHEGQVRANFGWSSYTSRNNVGEGLSSIRGNQRYRFVSQRAGTKKFINYAFQVLNFSPPDEPVDARFYFPLQLTAQPDANGKTGIFIHDGNTNQLGGGSGSGGCLISPFFYTLRDELIRIYQAEYIEQYGLRDTEVDKALNLNRAQSQALWEHSELGVGLLINRLDGANWNKKIQGTLWLIRPDEKSLH